MKTFVVPSQIGKYSLLETIGAGAFSYVKLALQNESKQHYACKIIPINTLITNDLWERTEEEIRVNQQMYHPGVVQIIDLLKDEFNIYIFMEYCPGGDLYKFLIDRGKIPEPEAANLIYQLLNAIQYIHSIGVAHRDIKPENILLDQQGRIKISDFGLSKFVGKDGLVTTPCGSLCYTSPECLTGKPYDGRISDLWSIGVILYALVTGQLPWSNRNQAQLIEQIRAGDYSIPTSLSPECSDLISRLLTVDPAKRITESEALSHRWLCNIESNAISPESKSIIISMRKVDNFFNKPDWEEDCNVSESDIERSYTQKEIEFNRTARTLQHQKIITLDRNTDLKKRGKSGIIRISGRKGGTLGSRKIGFIRRNNAITKPTIAKSSIFY
ncbi:CAMK family protein kinase [Histomonas meleagridis]|uniref:CAMK family protein kinase n=1 Tax=Histomonas meleagridis TaxID=135588 RepID=UPI003559EE9F|nr:CAMK family protein kinase [Histomonas meleagridis]KAH0806432.1 CAMK family protein kinase [Histomonas meleagridis]